MPIEWEARDGPAEDAQDRSEQPDARRILEERFAKGEITQEELKDRMRVFEQVRSGRSHA